MVPILLVMFSTFFFNEFVIYYLHVWLCQWPDVSVENSSRILLLADTHLLGVRHGHWFDKLRREWQMYRSFQTLVSLLHPEAIFFLGDQFDEGHWSNEELFLRYSARFDQLFAVPNDIKRFVVAGNHDLGFHYAIIPPRMEWFERLFNRSLIDEVVIGENNFVLINSMALHGDGCRLCDTAVHQLKSLSKKYACFRNSTLCHGNRSNGPTSAPIVLQHFPLFRENDAACDEIDQAPDRLKNTQFRPSWDCLSNESTTFLLDALHPRAVFSGHTHFGCKTWWPSPYSFWEYTVSSFSWRNIPTPTVLLLTVSPVSLAVEKCFLPDENTVIFIYVGVFSLLLILLMFSCLWRRRFYSSVKSE